VEISMTSIDPALESINSYLHRLTTNVGDEEQVDFFKAIFVPGIKNPDNFLQPYISWSKSAHEGWDKWKAKCSSQTDTIREYEEKLKKCDAYLALMQSILLEKSSTAQNVQASVTPTEAKTVEDSDEQSKLSQIQALLTRERMSGISEIVFEENVDKAFEIVKTLKFSYSTQNILIDIFQIFLNQNTVRLCKKAYEVARFKQHHQPGDTYLLDQIIEKCMSLRTNDAESFLAEMLKYYPKFSAVITHEAPPIRPMLSKAADTRNPIRDALIRQGDENAIKGYEADNLADQRKFRAAVSIAQTIPDLVNRRGTIASIYGKCCDFGDEEALRFAMELAIQHEEAQYRISYLYGVTEACKKQKLRDLALEAASRIEDPTLRDKSIGKIKRAPEFRKL